MPPMTKIVNVRTRVAVRNVNPPICGTVNGIVMTTGDILKCLCKRAHVEEVLPNGTTIKLNMSNYYTDNGAGLNAKKNLPATEKKPVENPARFKVPVAPVEKTEKQVVETKTEEECTAEEALVINEDVKLDEAEAITDDAFVTGVTVCADGEEDAAEGVNDGDDATNFATETATDVEESNISGTVTNNHHNNKKHKHKK